MVHLTKTLSRLAPAVAGAALLLAAPAHAQVNWTDWTSSGTNTAAGTLTLGATPVGVAYAGPYQFVQTSCAGGNTNYWVPNVYTSATVPNPPTACDIIALTNGGAKTITFSQAVTNPFFAFLSWNGQAGTPVPFTGLNGATPVTPTLSLLSQGTSFWGPGTASVSGNGLIVNGEVGGTVQLLGTFTQISFTDNSENWHGFTVGAVSVAATTAPEPATLVLVGTGLLAVVGATRRRRTSHLR
jgi:hypothetical protein